MDQFTCKYFYKSIRQVARSVVDEASSFYALDLCFKPHFIFKNATSLPRCQKASLELGARTLTSNKLEAGLTYLKVLNAADFES